MKALRMTYQQLQDILAKHGKEARRTPSPDQSALPPAKPQAAKPSKHRAVKTTVDGKRFDSKLEARVWGELKLREAAGEIRKLRRQVRFSLFAPGGEHLGTYAADFVYDEHTEGLVLGDGVWGEELIAWRRVVADAKSFHTRKLPGWNKTKRLMAACHNINVVELP